VMKIEIRILVVKIYLQSFNKRKGDNKEICLIIIFLLITSQKSLETIFERFKVLLFFERQNLRFWISLTFFFTKCSQFSNNNKVWLQKKSFSIVSFKTQFGFGHKKTLNVFKKKHHYTRKVRS
jgi:hypothetical protein